MNDGCDCRTAPATPGLLKKIKWHLTGDTWQVTHDRWHMKRYTWCGMIILSKCQLSSSNSLGFMMFEDLEEKAD